MKIDPNVFTESFQPLSNSDLNASEEAMHLANLVNGELAGALSKYEEPRVEGAGGSGLVISAIYEPFSTRRAIKIPRKRLFDMVTKEPPTVDVDPELHALSKISHENITRLYEAHALSGGRGYCMITEYVCNPRPLDKFAYELCCSQQCRKNAVLRASALKQLAAVVYEVIDALSYMHKTAQLIHFDIKPDNILVSDSGKAFITDLGFARDITKYGPGKDVSIGFTWKYAHPLLTDPDQGARITRNPARAKNTIPSDQLLPSIDLFAFGRTIQEVLKRLEDVYKETIHSDYTFNYLHLTACLCLDGKNAANGYANREHFVSDQASGMPIDLFQTQKFNTFSELRTALQRLLGRRRLEDDLPELDRWSATTLNVSDFGITTLTPRVKSVIEHPTFLRLSGESQLSMLDTIFPTATHTRLQHSLGVYHSVCDYITSLYHDPENPTFRVLFDTKKCERALLTALVHDIGQATFGHELEEVNEEEFSHKEIGSLILKQSTLTDVKGRTIRDLIEKNDFDCWSANFDKVLLLLSGRSDDAFDGVLHDILDGQLDADKLDYLVRDSIEARVPYGHGIDQERFIRSLTTVGVRKGTRSFLKLAIKRKGAASAEAFAFARYQLYQSLYWHHTFRAIKAMMITAASETFHELLSSASPRNLFDKYVLRTAYLKFVIDPTLESHENSKSKTGERRKIKSDRSLLDEVYNRLRTANDVPHLGKYAEDKTIQFLWKLSKEKAKHLIKDLIDRNYYKRVLEIPLTDFKEEGWVHLREKLNGSRRLELQEQIEKALLNSLRSAIQDQMKVRTSLVEDEVLQRTEKITNSRFAFIIDLPLRGWTSTGEEPLFVSDYKRRHFRASSGEQGSLEKANLWSDHLGSMMRQIAFFRVYCEPELHGIVTTVLRTSDIFTSVSEVVPGIRQR